MTDRHHVSCWLTDMDGVLVHEEQALPGAAEFIAALQENGLRFLVLTNNSIYTARDLRARLLRSGIDLPEDRDYATTAGFALSVLKHIPEVGERFAFGGWQFEIVDMDGFKIDKLLASEVVRKRRGG